MYHLCYVSVAICGADISNTSFSLCLLKYFLCYCYDAHAFKLVVMWLLWYDYCDAEYRTAITYVWYEPALYGTVITSKLWNCYLISCSFTWYENSGYLIKICSMNLFIILQLWYACYELARPLTIISVHCEKFEYVTVTIGPLWTCWCW
jgi:hypothetical protein